MPCCHPRTFRACGAAVALALGLVRRARSVVRRRVELCPRSPATARGVPPRGQLRAPRAADEPAALRGARRGPAARRTRGVGAPAPSASPERCRLTDANARPVPRRRPQILVIIGGVLPSRVTE